MTTKQQFLQSLFLTPFLGFFIKENKTNIPTLLCDDEFVISKNVINKLSKTDNNFAITLKNLSNGLQRTGIQA